ncbi:MAG: hypothetical protein N4A64_09580 [Marinisporobacter sp.]|jgi:DNA invertase Pin-like site-specific DNA recombinase|nr:hypothetical protein [Marinisporobacter sp.]
MIHSYDENGEHKKIRFINDVNLISDKGEIAFKLAKSNGKLEELKKAYENELARNNELVARRYEIYKQEKIEELKDSRNDKLPSIKEQIEIYFSQGKSYDEIALLTESKRDYIYKVICNYKKKNEINKNKVEYSDTVELILGCKKANMSVNQIVSVAKVSRQYVYRVLKEHNIPYPHKKSNNGKVSLQNKR